MKWVGDFVLLVSFYAIGFCTCFSLLLSFKRQMFDILDKNNKLLKLNEELGDELKKKEEENNKLCDMVREANTNILKHLTVQNILLYCMSILEKDDEKISLSYNRLFFWGIPEGVLNDGENIGKFMCDLVDDRILVSGGEKPFICSFTNNGSSIENLEEMLKKSH